MMPGKMNPVVPEYANQVALRIHGLDATVTMALDAAQLQLNAMLPVIASCLFEAQELLGHGTEVLARRCVEGIEVNEDRMRGYSEEGLGQVSVLATQVGYEASSKLAVEAERVKVSPDQLVGSQHEK
jgi:aspartate ammonia-lyase